MLSPGYQSMLRAEQIAQPARTLVLLEEHPDSINDGTFFIDMSASQLVDVPGAFHDGGMNAGLADGHVEFWVWRDGRTVLPPTYTGILNIIPSPGNVDLLRLCAAATYRP